LKPPHLAGMNGEISRYRFVSKAKLRELRGFGQRTFKKYLVNQADSNLVFLLSGQAL
jgi:hypothetical protein